MIDASPLRSFSPTNVMVSNDCATIRHAKQVATCCVTSLMCLLINCKFIMQQELFHEQMIHLSAAGHCHFSAAGHRHWYVTGHRHSSAAGHHHSSSAGHCNSSVAGHRH